MLFMTVSLCAGCHKKTEELAESIKRAAQLTLALQTEEEPKTSHEAAGTEQETVVTEQEASVTEQEAETEAETEDASKRIIVIGDSRTVGMYCSQVYGREEFPAHIFYNISETDYTADVGDTVFVAKGGEDFYWLQMQALALAELQITENSVLVFWLGVNDTEHIEKYLEYINGAPLLYGIPVYYMTLGPCEGTWEKSEAGVLAFNEALKTRLDSRIGIIDMYNFLKQGLEEGRFATLDGLHYDYDTCRAAYDYMLEQLR